MKTSVTLFKAKGSRYASTGKAFFPEKRLYSGGKYLNAFIVSRKEFFLSSSNRTLVYFVAKILHCFLFTTVSSFECTLYLLNRSMNAVFIIERDIPIQQRDRYFDFLYIKNGFDEGHVHISENYRFWLLNAWKNLKSNRYVFLHTSVGCRTVG